MIMIGNAIEELRKKKKLTKKEFAKLIEVDSAQITRYVKEEQNVSSKTIIKICKAFNVSADWLLGLKKDEVS